MKTAPDELSTLPQRTQGDAWQPETSVRGRNVALSRASTELKGRSGRVLEAGAGTARFLRALRSRLPQLEGHACDIARPGLSFARQDDRSLAVVQGDFSALPYRSHAFDVVLVFDVLEHLPHPDQGVAETWRVLAPGGMLHTLVPCEGQPLTLHWLMWKASLAADLKEKRVGHLQRFTHRSIRRLLESHGFQIQRVSYSMHPLGQLKDILTHSETGPEFPEWLRSNPVYRLLSLALWGGSYLESSLLRRVSLSSVALHVTAIKR